MVGAEPGTFQMLEPALKTLAPGRGDVAPSPGLADDLYESLDTERAVTRRFNPHWVWPAAAAAALLQGNPGHRGRRPGGIAPLG